ncbi:MAG TPA: 3'(2'),5'-bisphosphate nucleotidase CysQ [Vicinamibacterales bacterium]|nr:3'(2'),5'-bisphosphate nucleotidase CysQ [Vicinamibacterales bacterium]
MTFGDRDVALLSEIAREAGRAILALYGTDCFSAAKADASPLTRADTDADAIICERLAAAFPGVPIVSEESAPAADGGAGVFFLVDPLDGTREFLNRTDEFTVNIALVHHGRPAAGVVFAPALDELFAASSTGAARRYANGAACELAIAAFDRTRPLRVIGSRSHAGAAMQEWLGTLDVPYTFVAAGSSLKFCRIAEGRADIYPRFGHTSQWDTAAAQAVLERAGGTVTDLSGAPLRYGCDKPMLNPFFTAIGDPAVAALIGK